MLKYKNAKNAKMQKCKNAKMQKLQNMKIQNMQTHATMQTYKQCKPT